MYPVKFQTQSDLSGRALGDSLMDDVRYVDLYILHSLVSISVEMSQHLCLLCIVCYLTEFSLEPLFQTVLCLAIELFLASGASYTIHKIVAVAVDLVSCLIFLALD